MRLINESFVPGNGAGSSVASVAGTTSVAGVISGIGVSLVASGVSAAGVTSVIDVSVACVAMPVGCGVTSNGHQLLVVVVALGAGVSMFVD